MKLIGLVGKAKSGKSTVATILHTHRAYTTIAFADPIKRIVRDVFNFDGNHVWGSDAYKSEPDQRYPLPDGVATDEIFLSSRRAMQTLGEEWGRRLCFEHVWVHYCFRCLAAMARGHNAYSSGDGLGPYTPYGVPPCAVVISDVRHQNEAQAVKGVGGVLWRIDRKGAGLVGRAAKHPSETEIGRIRVDSVVSNNDTRDALVQCVLDLEKQVPECDLSKLEEWGNGVD